ncbi:MAG TPA: dynamin family protein [Pseudonocardiaceae bacterium]|nr:dynamin family protein [Pseudonocardiaceae bacterium]
MAVPLSVPLPVLVRQTRSKLTAFLAEADPTAAAWVEQVRTTRPQTPTVVVVGETNRGKSSLVNALLAAPGLSPVAALDATTSYLVFRHGPGWAATAHFADGSSTEFPVGELARWVCAGTGAPDAGAPDPGPPHRGPARQLDVQAPLPLLQQFSLIDTPGVGGLDAGHGELAREAAAAATALLFVLDASAPITRGELDFLAGLGDRVETVLFALTKTDLHRGWRTILETDRELLARHAPRFAAAVLHPVSARLAEQADHAPTAALAAVLREQSGVAALRSAVQQQVSGRVAMLGEANTLRALSTALDGLAGRLRARQRALDAGAAGTAQALRARRDELSAARRSAGRSWQLRLRAEIQRARAESGHDVAARIRGAQTRLRAALDAADRARLQQFPHHVDATLQVLAGQVGAALTARVARVADAALAELFRPDELAAVRAGLLRHDRPPVVLQPPQPRAGTAEDKLLVAVGFSGGLGIGRLATLPLAGLGASAGLLVLPVSLALGLGAGWWMARTRRHAADKAQLRQWLSDVLADARATLDHTVAEQLIDAEQQLAIALEQALARRAVAIEDELRDVEQALRLDAAERSRLIAATQERLDRASAGQARVTALLGRLRELRDRPDSLSAPHLPGLP